MLKAYQLMEAPDAEPVSLSAVKAFLKIDGTDEDALITSLIPAARRMCENFTRRAFITQTWMLTIDHFHYRDDCIEEGYSIGPVPSFWGGVGDISLSKSPIQSIEGIVAYDTYNVPSTVDPAVYTLDKANGRILLNSGQSWPSELRRNAAGEITFVAGYGDNASDVPGDIGLAITQTVGQLYENRNCASFSDGVMAILSAYQLPEAFGV